MATQFATRGDALPDLVPARMLNEFAYCPRLAYLEWVQGEFEDSADTEEGRFHHRRVDEQSGRQASGDAAASDAGPRPVRSAMMSAPRAGFIARIDLLEVEGARAVPVDYKHGRAPEAGREPWEPERVQLCAQALILRENGFRCDSAVIYYPESKTRVDVPIDDDLVERTLALLEQLREVGVSGRIPPPLTDSPKCPRCSLVGICLPDEVNFLTGSAQTEDAALRRLVPPGADALPLYVQVQGATVAKRGDVLEIRVDGQVADQARLLTTSQVCLFGHIQITTDAVRELCVRSIPICYFSSGGWFYGITHGMSHKNVELRQHQYRAAIDAEAALRLACRFVQAKVRNCRTLLRRNHPQPPAAALSELARLARRASTARDLPTLLGIEGAAAKVYFSHFQGMFKLPADQPALQFDFSSRNRRPPRDPVNALLSFLYALLVKEMTVTLLAAGFDPFLGFYHQPRYGRPALALDLVEEFRPIIADSVVLTLINGGQIRPDDFTQVGGAVSLTPRGKRQLLAAYERRLETVVSHPVFGYSISYRRIFSVQARLLARYLSGELARYRSFCTR
jgi:CRISPR-associated protein Cas1